jgi:hypothetical protein
MLDRKPPMLQLFLIYYLLIQTTLTTHGIVFSKVLLFEHAFLVGEIKTI